MDEINFLMFKPNFYNKLLNFTIMKRKMFFMGVLTVVMAGAIFWSCQKDEVLMNTEDGVMLKKGNVAVMETSVTVDTLIWEDVVCAGEEHEFCLEFPQAYLPNGNTTKTNVNVQIWNPELEEEGDWEEIFQGNFDFGPKCFTYKFLEEGVYNLKYKIGSGGFTEIDVNVANCGCETLLSGKTECGTFGEQDQYNRKAVYFFSTELTGEFKIQGGLTNFTGNDYNVTATVGEVESRIPGNSSNRIVSVTGQLDDCGEVEVTIHWKSTNSNEFITGDWSVELSGNKILEIDALTCNDEGKGYTPEIEE